VLIFSLVVVPNLHLLGVWLLSGSQDIPPWLQYSLIVPRHMSTWLSDVALMESVSEVAIPKYIILFYVLHELDVLTSL
jgi:hypothetical protein